MIRQISKGMTNFLLLLIIPSSYMIRKMKKDSNIGGEDENATFQKIQNRKLENHNHKNYKK